MLNLKNIKKVHFIGISSPFSSFCAQKLISLGIQVTASELSQNNDNAISWLQKKVLFPGGHSAAYITPDLDLVVYPNGPIPGNPECDRAQELKLNTITLPKLVGGLSSDYKVIAIAGTHGKTTTTALAVWLLHKLDKTPNFIIADSSDKIFGLNKNYNLNPDSPYLVIEACEYRRQFLDRAPSPYISLITNIDLDHTDYYHDQSDYNDAFNTFISSTKDVVIMNLTGKNESLLKKNNSLNYYQYLDLAKTIKCSVLPGAHNHQNLALVLALGVYLGYDESKAITALSSFPGVTKRFEYLGKTVKDNLVYRDYAHNPHKLQSLVNAVKESYPDKKFVLIFQPHSRERSHSFKNEFAASLVSVDQILIPNIFIPTREKTLFLDLISDQDFVDVIKSLNPNCIFTQGFENLKLELDKLDQTPNTIFVFASAGDLQDKIKEILYYSP